MVRELSVDEVLEQLRATPKRLRVLTRNVDPVALQQRPEPEEWSAVEVLAHLRACADRWGEAATRIVLEDRPTIRGINPRQWIKETDYPSLDFGPSLRAFVRQRADLLAVLDALTTSQWQRTGTTTGAGAPLTHSVHDYAQRLAIHERPHLRQLAATLQTVSGHG